MEEVIPVDSKVVFREGIKVLVLILIHVSFWKGPAAGRLLHVTKINFTVHFAVHLWPIDRMDQCRYLVTCGMSPPNTKWIQFLTGLTYHPLYHYFDLELKISTWNPLSFEPGKSVFIQISSLCYMPNWVMDIKWLIRKRRRTYFGLPVMLRIFQTFNNFNKYHNFQTNGFLQPRYCSELEWPQMTLNNLNLDWSNGNCQTKSNS